MEEIEFSVMSYTPDGVGQLEQLLAPFEAKHQVKVNIRTLPWETSWSEILKYTFYGTGPVVSEVGNTWVNSLSKMNALRAINRSELAEMGGEDAFLPATFQGQESFKDSYWSVPWLAEIRVILYRRDLLEEAGIDGDTAFTTHDRLAATLERLRESGVSYPWLVPTVKTLNTLHSLPNWIWGAGGDFVDADLRTVTVSNRASRSGIEQYYSLYRYIDPQFYGYDASAAEGAFMSGASAVTINGPWVVFPSYDVVQPNVRDKIGVALMPGTPCVLASNLVLWRHAPVREELLGVELVKYLTTPEAQRRCSLQTGLLPARQEALKLKPFADDPFYQVFIRGLKSGRPLPTMRLWGLIEERLTAAFGNLWQTILADPEPDVEAAVRAELEPLAQKLNRILQ